MNAAWVGVVGALGGVVITGAIGLVTAVLTRGWQRQDHEAAMIEARRESRAELRRSAYAEYLVATNRFTDHIRSWMLTTGRTIEPDRRLVAYAESPSEFAASYDLAETHARLLASPALDAALADFGTWVVDQTRVCFKDLDPDAFNEHEEREKVLVDVMRQELRADLRIDPT